MVSDERLLRQALSALEGVLLVARLQGVTPTDITLTIIAALRRRLGLPDKE